MDVTVITLTPGSVRCRRPFTMPSLIDTITPTLMSFFTRWLYSDRDGAEQPPQAEYKGITLTSLSNVQENLL